MVDTSSAAAGGGRRPPRKPTGPGKGASGSASPIAGKKRKRRRPRVPPTRLSRGGRNVLVADGAAAAEFRAPSAAQRSALPRFVAPRDPDFRASLRARQGRNSVVYRRTRRGAAANRRASLRGIATQPGLDRDEAPPASTTSGGAGAMVELLDASENRRHGAALGGFYRTNSVDSGDEFIHAAYTDSDSDDSSSGSSSSSSSSASSGAGPSPLKRRRRGVSDSAPASGAGAAHSDSDSDADDEDEDEDDGYMGDGED
jgi:hypothetical protein